MILIVVKPQKDHLGEDSGKSEMLMVVKQTGDTGEP